MPTKTELLDYLAVNGTVYPGQDIWCAVVAPEFSNGKDWIQIGNVNHPTGRSHTGDLGTYPSWGSNTTNTLARFYCEVLEETQTSYTINFPVKTTCDVLVVGGGGAGGHNGGGGGGGDVLYFQNVDIPSGTYDIKVGKGGTSTGAIDNGAPTTHGVKSEFYNIVAGGGGKGLSYNYYDDFISIVPPAENYTNPLTGLTETSQGASGGVRVSVSE